LSRKFHEILTCETAWAGVLICLAGGYQTMFKVLRVSNILMASIAIVSTIAPASAQGFDVNQIHNTDRMASKTTVIVDPNATRAWGYRVSSGSHTTSGWEKSLTDGDPNLRH